MKQFIFFRIFLGIFLLGSILLIGKGWHFATAGFRMQKIAPTEEHLASYYCDNKESISATIFDQPFIYLNRGAQIYCFESSDGQYVLKLIRHHKYRSPLWANILPLIEKKQNAESYRKSIYARALKSYTMAAKELKNESGTLFVHLTKTDHLKKKIMLIDQAHRRFIIDLDSRFFILQKKADTILSKALLEKKHNNDLAGAKTIIRSFLSSITNMMEKQITIRDKNCLINFGVKENQVQLIDLGAFISFEEGTDFAQFDKKARSITKHLQRWVKKQYPELLPFVDEELNDHLLSLKKNTFFDKPVTSFTG